MKIRILTLIYLFVNTISILAQTVTDVDGNTYNTISIGNQIWLTENLKVTKYNDQVPISLVLDDASWSTQTQDAYCYYQGDIANASIYGNLYNWHVVNNAKNVCPSGYHVPSIADWEELITFVGGNAVAGGKLKEMGLEHWLDPNTGADNSSSFTLLPSGWRANNNGFYESLSQMAFVWSSTSVDAQSSSIILVGYDSPACYTSESHILTGLPIRCLKDETASINENLNQQPILVYPNIAKNVITIESKQNLEIDIFNVEGQKIKSFKLMNNKTDIDVLDLASGVYIINALTDKGIVTYKFIKE
jgi:uncharacterized protein (TIGR02145 family)